MPFIFNKHHEYFVFTLTEQQNVRKKGIKQHKLHLDFQQSGAYVSITIISIILEVPRLYAFMLHTIAMYSRATIECIVALHESITTCNYRG